MGELRRIILGCGLTEEVKWGKPCYTFQEGNVAILYGLKACCAVGFLKGSLLADPQGILLKPGENSQAGRWIRFTSTGEILALEPVVRAYVQRAIEVEKAGLKVEFKQSTTLVFPEELKKKMAEAPDFKQAFLALTPGRQRGYNLFFSAPKQSKTRASRVEQHVWRVMAGKGITECACGRSKWLPKCDGSHRQEEKL